MINDYSSRQSGSYWIILLCRRFFTASKAFHFLFLLLSTSILKRKIFLHESKTIKGRKNKALIYNSLLCNETYFTLFIVELFHPCLRFTFRDKFYLLFSTDTLSQFRKMISSLHVWWISRFHLIQIGWSCNLKMENEWANTNWFQ